MAAIAAQVGDLVELNPSAALGNASGLFIVRALRTGGYLVSTPENAQVTFAVADSDIARLFVGAASGTTIQTPTEAVLVSGIDATLGNVVQVTLTAARLVGVPLKPVKGQELEFQFTQGGAGGFAVTWNAVFKVTWADTGNATGKVSAIRFRYDGTNWKQVAAQSPYV